MSPPECLRIAIVSRSDESVGGASRAAHILAKLLRTAGHHVDHWIGYGKAHQDIPLRNLSEGPTLSRLVRLFHRTSQVAGLSDLLALQQVLFQYALRTNRYDLVHFHDTVTAFSPLGIWRTSRQVPVFMTLHDCAAFTGGCIYPKDCTRFEDRCGACPQRRDWPMSSPLFDFSGLQQNIRRYVHRDGRIATIAPCQWMIDLAQRSRVFVRPTELIRNAVDLRTIKPEDKLQARRALGLPTDRKILLFTASHLNDERKGFRWALQAHERLVSDKPPLLVAVGHIPQDRRPFERPGLHLVGFIGDLDRIARYYAAADLFVFPTMADNSPLVTLEAMAAGTPVLSFATGGVPEQVVHGETGYLTTPGDVDGLVAGMRAALDGDTSRRWGQAARRRAEALFSYQAHLDAHLALYRRILSEQHVFPSPGAVCTSSCGRGAQPTDGASTCVH